MDAPDLPMHMPIAVYSSAVLTITATRVSGSVVEIVYRAAADDSEVLMLHGRLDGMPSELVRCDARFWTITLDGRPASDEDLDALVLAPGRHIDVDPDLRSITVTSAR